MKQVLFKIRFWLEIIALPVFVFLIMHLGGHGFMLLLEPEHSEAEHIHDHDISFDIFESALSVEVVAGLLFLLLFVWLWQRPDLKRWVPCSHDHCHKEIQISHTLAIVALCLHFFPEAGVRHEMMHGVFEGGVLSFIGLLGFVAHSGVDIIVALVISSYWKTTKGFILSISAIALFWVLALLVAEPLIEWIPTQAEGVLYLVSAFLLSMFVHKPHKPVHCKSCEK